MKLVLGVNDVSYHDKDSKKTTTTGQVANYLEDDYHIMRTFVELHESDIGGFLVDALAGELESRTQKKPTDLDLVGPMGKIESEFRDYLDKGEWRATSGVTIQAAEQGISHRRKHSHAKANPKRTEFVDTGLYQASFRAWLEA